MAMLSEHMLALTTGDLSQLSTLYEIEDIEGGMKRLVPKQSGLRKVFQEIRFKMGERQIVSRVEIVSVSGDVSVITFNNVKRNPKLSPALFDLSPSTP
jgi:outer membrane lipoprotein-sorting protein